MIDFVKLNEAYVEDRFYSLQLEIGDVCRQGCVYCYMNALPRGRNALSDETILQVLEDSVKLKIGAVEWLGGEPLLRKSVFRFLEAGRDLGLRNNLWTGGLPLEDGEILRKTASLCANGLIAFHLSSIDPAIYTMLHPGRTERDIDVIISAVKNLLDLGYPRSQVLNSVTYTGLQPPGDMIRTMDLFKREFGIATSLNVYNTYLRPGSGEKDLEKFIPSPRDTALVYGKYAGIMDAPRLPMNCVNKQYCSATVAVLNDGSVTPCATIREGCRENVHSHGFYEAVVRNRDFLIFKVLKDSVRLHEDCRVCSLNDSCWGCRSRAYVAGKGLYGKDPRCFRAPKATAPRSR
jgi:radical SAM protein with 4Fe4S-binding SPASM domain